MIQKDSEDKIQALYHQWLWNNYPLTRGLCYHIANGGTRGAISQAQILQAGKTCGGSVSRLISELLMLIKRQAGIEGNKLKAIGVVDGIPDYHHAIPSRATKDGIVCYNSLYIEFKQAEANMNTDHVKLQSRRQEQLRAAGNMVVVCKSLKEAQDVILNYLPACYLQKTV
jgi:hypothetical protein